MHYVSLNSSSGSRKLEGVFNEGGLFGEREGWHLPSFPTTGFVNRDLSSGLPNSAAGVGFFITTFKLNIPKGVDAMLSFTFQEPQGQAYRAILFVNGWMMGKRVANLGYALLHLSRFAITHSPSQTSSQVPRT